jgi:hypothetical protein
MKFKRPVSDVPNLRTIDTMTPKVLQIASADKETVLNNMLKGGVIIFGHE